MGWTADQWIEFACFTAAGLAGLGLIALWIRDRRRGAVRTGAIAIDPTHPYAVHDCNLHADPVRAWRIEAGHIDVVPLYADDPVAEHLAAGPGSLTTLREQEERDTLIRITHADLIDPEIAERFAFAFDRPAHAPGRTEASVIDEGGIMVRFEVALEPAMRTARLWLLQGQSEHRGGASARAELDRWRINTPTGEYALVGV